MRTTRKPPLALLAMCLAACAARQHVPPLDAASAGASESVIVLEHDPGRGRQVYWTSGGYVVVFDYSDAVAHLGTERFRGDAVEREVLLASLVASGSVGEPLDLGAVALASPATARQASLRAAFLVAEILESGRAGVVDTERTVVLGSLKLVRFSDDWRRGRRFETRDGRLVLEIVDAHTHPSTLTP